VNGVRVSGGFRKKKDNQASPRGGKTAGKGKVHGWGEGKEDHVRYHGTARVGGRGGTGANEKFRQRREVRGRSEKKRKEKKGFLKRGG